MNMKSLPILLILVCIDSVAYQKDASTRRLEEELASRLRWESIWADSGIGLRRLPNGSAKLAVYLTGHAVTFCSHDLGICEVCQMNGIHLGKGVKSQRCDETALPCGPTHDDETAVRLFSQEALGTIPVPSASKTGRTTFNPEAPHGLTGVMTWSTIMNLGTPEQIIEDYRRSRSPQMPSLRKWLIEKHRGSGYASITVGCYKQTDPLVYFYGDRPRVGPIVFEAFWDAETEQWTEAGFLDRPADLKQIEQLKTKIMALSCDTVTF